MNFGERLHTVRKDRKLTLEALALKCNTSETVIRNYEKSRRLPNIEMLIRLCDALNVSPDYLLQDELLRNPCTAKSDILNTYTALTPSQKEFFNDFLKTLDSKNEIK